MEDLPQPCATAYIRCKFLFRSVPPGINFITAGVETIDAFEFNNNGYSDILILFKIRNRSSELVALNVANVDNKDEVVGSFVNNVYMFSCSVSFNVFKINSTLKVECSFKKVVAVVNIVFICSCVPVLMDVNPALISIGTKAKVGG